MGLPERYQGGGGLDRRSQKALARSERSTALQVTRARQVAEIEAAKVQAVGYVGTVALIETGHLGTVEAALAAHQPHNAHRLQYVADRYTEAIAERAFELGRRLS